MIRFKFSLLLYLLVLTSVTIETEAQDPLYTFCPNTTTFVRNSTYQTNLNSLLSSLSSNGTNNLGFSNASAGRDPNDVYGLYLCRGDVSTSDCQNCVTSARQKVVQSCPVEQVAVIYYDNCLLRYSNQYIFSSVSSQGSIFMWNTGNITGNQTRFDELVGTTMREIASQASSASSGAKKFAVKQANVSTFQTLYTLAQCTPDLSSIDCDRCLQEAIGQLPGYSSGKQGGRALTPSCNVRYEIYPFYNDSAVPPPPPPPVVPSPPLPPPVSVPRPKGRSRTTIIVVVIVASAVGSIIIFCMSYCFLRKRARKKNNIVQEDKVGIEISDVESLQYDLATIEAATRKFADDNKLGEGGFGEVYKGTLPNGQEIAVKRLSPNSGQGAEEFKNEVIVVAKLQHRNLVRLLGFCLEAEEKILVYEFVPNKSLDYFLFDPEKQRQLDWSRRYKIIGGIARGILYLHQDSRLRIIHRDLKASNILLDGDMNPKISDFGMARIFVVDQTQENTRRVVGTYGYMSPEYAMHGQFSVKSDVYSFGVLVLEIVSGRKNSSFYQAEGAVDVVSFVWKHWRDGTPLEVLDPTLLDLYSRTEVIRCIHIGLLCVQEDPADRPTMATIVLMLNSYSVSLPLPQEPAFFIHSKSEQSTFMKGLDSEQSKSKSVPLSVDEESITEVYPR